jgi:hypothetical protein
MVALAFTSGVLDSVSLTKAQTRYDPESDGVNEVVLSNAPAARLAPETKLEPLDKGELNWRALISLQGPGEFLKKATQSFRFTSVFPEIVRVTGSSSVGSAEAEMEAVAASAPVGASRR